MILGTLNTPEGSGDRMEGTATAAGKTHNWSDTRAK